MIRTMVIANPYAGSGRGRVAGGEAVRMISRLGHEVQLGATEGPGHATELAAGAAASGRYDLVVAVGGDGTVHEVATGLAGTDCPLGVLASGSGNDFARGLGCFTPAEGLAALSGGVLREMDVAELDGRKFFNSVGLLASGLVSNRAAGYWRWLGRSRYTLAAVGVLMRYRGQTVAWDFRGGPDPGSIDGRYLMVEICNGRYTGGGFRFAPDADFCDGLLDVCLIEPIGPAQGLALLPSASAGKRLDHPAITNRQCRQIEFTLDEPSGVHLDGEPSLIPAGSHTVRITGEKLRVWCHRGKAGQS